MPNLPDIEAFLESQTRGEFKVTMTREEKVAYLREHASYVKAVLFKMRGFGRKAWSNFLWAFGLEESIVLTPIS